jgi:hypothetical protein
LFSQLIHRPQRSKVAGNIALDMFDSILHQPASRVVAQRTVWDDI